MSYQVLARKWRPKQFTEMVGQEHVLKALVNALDDNRLHHAYLFTGTRGVGKTSIARLFAKALNCEEGVSSMPCGQCSACAEIAEGRFVDLIEVDAASRTKVEDTRELLENVQYAPTRGRFKVYLIDEVHMLSKSSFNALLKTLEEPPPHVKFLLATTDPQKLPVTVLSRCLQFNLKNMIPKRIVEHLQQVLSAEKISFEEGALWLLARSADGSMRDALSLTDQSIAFGAGSVKEVDVRIMLGTIDLRLVYQMLSALAVGDGLTLLKSVEDLAQFSPDYNAVLGDLVSLLHRIAIAQTVPAALDNSLGDQEQVEQLAAQLSAEDVQLFYQIALMGRKDLPLVPDAREGLEMTLMRMLAFRPAQSSHLQSVNLQNQDGQAPLKKNDALTQLPASDVSSDHPQSENGQYLADNQPVLGVNREEQDIAISGENNRAVSDRPAEILVNSAVDEIVSENKTGAIVTLPAQVNVISQDAENNIMDIEAAVVDADFVKSGAVETIDLMVTALDVNVNPSVGEKTQTLSAPNIDTVSSDVEHLASLNQQDIAPWEDDYQAYPQSEPPSLNKPAVQQAVENRPAVDSQIPSSQVPERQDVPVAPRKLTEQPTPESSTSQINISTMLAAPVVEIAKLGLEDWPALVGVIGFTGMTAHIAENLSLESVQGFNLQFNVSKVQKNVLDHTQENRIKTLLSQYFECDLNVTFDSKQSTRETPWQCFEKLRAKRLRSAITLFQGDEIVQKIAAAFTAEIDRSSIMPVN
ncbi:MAG: DNA polymerase-3 subunit gamma/tau [Oceanospirillaceae bacterium]|jgi:DNA polymerase-3 subunit gamma/tau